MLFRSVQPQYDVTYEVDGVLKHTEKVIKGESPKEVPSDPTKTGYEFKGWQVDGAGVLYDKDGVKALKINKATKLVAKFKASADIVPGEDPKPTEYITVTFNKGEGKALAGIGKFHVKKDKVVDLTSLAPTAIPQEGYKSTK